MAKANQRSRSNQKQHRLCNDYKIPIKYRRRYTHHNKDKWVGKDKYKDFCEWREKNK